MAAVVSFQLEGTAHDLDVAPRAGERAQFQRGDVEVTIEIDVDAQGRATSDCLLIARTAREVSNDVYRQLEERTSWLRLPESQPSSWPRGSGGGRVVPE